jgi:hypothetical protein
MELLDYTDKSFVVIGDTKNIKDRLKELGGRYNPNLTHPVTKERFSAWIFSKKQREKIESALNHLEECGSGNSPSSSVHESMGSLVEKGNRQVKPRGPEKDLIDTIVDPIQRLGLRDNGPDPPKKTRTMKDQVKIVERKIKKECPRLELNTTITFDTDEPELQEIPSFTMIVPHVEMKIKMKEKEEDLTLTIMETKKNMDGYIFEFRASDGNVSLDFVMVGKEWRILKS